MPSPAKLLASASGANTDPNFRNVTLLLHGDGSNGAQNNTFVDGSTNNFTITRAGNTTQGSFSPYGSRWSNYFDGNGDYLSISDNAAFDLAAGDWTVETWVNFSALPTASGAMTFVSQWESSLGWFFYLFNNAGTYQLYLTYSTTGSNQVNLSVNLSAAPSINTWNHVAFVRSGTNFLVFWNGTQVGSTQTLNATIFNSTSSVNIGQATSTYYMNGYLSDLRIVKGTAVYTANFTPPTAPLTAITNTSLLTCQSNRFRDASTNNFAITANGDARVSPFSPYAPTAPYSPATNGGSMYFDGSGDYLTAPSSTAFNLGGGDCTVECWVNFSSTANVPHIFEIGDSAVNRGVVYQTGGYIRLWNVSDRVVSNILISPNVWYHVAVSRVSGTYTLYVNGISQGTYASTVFPNVTSELHVGFQAFTGTSADYFNGYISNLRVVKGTAVYTANFTPPTAPVTAITNTSLLLNGTNAAIFDSAADNDLETVGNAQISTSVKKFGTGSMSFNGSTDWLVTPNKPEHNFGTGDFTIEAWAYPTGTNAQATLISNYNGPSSGWGLLLGSTGPSFGWGDTNLLAGSSAFNQNAWNHIAITRSGTSLRMFLNGTQVASATNSTDFTSTGALFVGRLREATAGFYWQGYLDDVRLTKGVARYTANFTPPTAAFPDQ